jgi:hypothetical protein
LGNHRDGDNMEDPGVDLKIILREIFRKWNGLTWAALSKLRIWTVGGHL